MKDLISKILLKKLPKKMDLADVLFLIGCVMLIGLLLDIFQLNVAQRFLFSFGFISIGYGKVRIDSKKSSIILLSDEGINEPKEKADIIGIIFIAMGAVLVLVALALFPSKISIKLF